MSCIAYWQNMIYLDIGVLMQVILTVFSLETPNK